MGKKQGARRFDGIGLRFSIDEILCLALAVESIADGGESDQKDCFPSASDVSMLRTLQGRLYVALGMPARTQSRDVVMKALDALDVGEADSEFSVALPDRCFLSGDASDAGVHEPEQSPWPRHTR